MIPAELEKRLTTVKEKRRDFLKYFLSTGLMGFAAVTLYPIFSFMKPPKQREVEVSSVSAGIADEFKPGDSKIIRFGKHRYWLLKKMKKTLKLFQQPVHILTVLYSTKKMRR
jgi:hypothetical protein